MNPLSSNTRAIMLLTAPLSYGRDAHAGQLLTATEYQQLAAHLRELKCQPADLIGTNADELIDEAGLIVNDQRLRRLLDRGAPLDQCIERWRALSLWVVSRADAEYPRALKARLREDAPPILYGRGDVYLADTGGLAVVGSRKATDDLYHYARGVGKLVSTAERTLISGGAKGVDQAAMLAALDAGGRVVGVASDGLEKAVTAREYRRGFSDDRLLLLSPNDPSCGQTAAHVQQRNRILYALADAALVVNAVYQQGGTWAGALDQLRTDRRVPIYVRATGAESVALSALRDGGALPWPEPVAAESFEPNSRGRSPIRRSSSRDGTAVAGSASRRTSRGGLWSGTRSVGSLVSRADVRQRGRCVTRSLDRTGASMAQAFGQ